MQRALITRDFSVSFVHDNGSSRTPALFNIATMWSALEGSILLRVLVLSGYLVHVARKFKARMTDPLVGWALLAMLLVSTSFFLLVLGPPHPFASLDSPARYDCPGPHPHLKEHLSTPPNPPSPTPR